MSRGPRVSDPSPENERVNVVYKSWKEVQKMAEGTKGLGADGGGGGCVRGGPHDRDSDVT